VRYDVFDLAVRDEAGNPSPRILDIEFHIRDFHYDPGRRLRGSVANGALKLAFSRWKSRGVQVIGAMPLTAFRMKRPAPRRWWSEGAGAAVRSFGDVMFIRFSRLLFGAVVILILTGLLIGAFWLAPQFL
jgi:hypothetical protein